MGRKASIKLSKKRKNELQSARKNTRVARSFVFLPCFNRYNDNCSKEFLKKI